MGLRLGGGLCLLVIGLRGTPRTMCLVHRTLAICKDGQLVVLLNIKQSAKELTLEDIDDSVQRLL